MPQVTIPYGRQQIEADDVEAVAEVLCSPWLTTGPKVESFEEAVCRFAGAGCGVAVSSGTAGLHAAMHAIGIGSGDEVIVPAITFAATANCVVYQGGTPVFADVQRDTLLLDPAAVREKITPRTKAIIAVDYAGQPCDYDALAKIAHEFGLCLVADACHALGAEYKGRKVGTLADLTIFSFHPVKHITTGEGGMVVTDDKALAERMRRFRNHGINADHRQREKKGSWFYEMEDLGWNYRLSDIHCALGISQLAKLPRWLEQRRDLARAYDALFANEAAIAPLAVRKDVVHARHLYVVRLADEAARERAFAGMRKEGIGVNVHYYPVHLHRWYRRRFGYGPGLCPSAEEAAERVLTLPLYAGLDNEDVRRVAGCLIEALGEA